ncbi:hypothetical protein [Streptomyces sp. NPDC020983]|uniref:hypothetical protein n=1 Tax=Streptomyces sp. NPDC020983 TaxID=3365106 RepID=UPI0037A80077
MTAPTETSTAQQAADGLRRLLCGLGAEPDLAGRVQGWTDISETLPYVYVPPLPAALVEHLVRLLSGARS